MAAYDAEHPPVRGDAHDALAVFLGEWRAEGKAYGTPKQTLEHPKGHVVDWASRHTTRWHSGQFFLVQDERATVGGHPFDTLSVMGIDAETGRYFAQSFENHGFSRRYDVSRTGRMWTFAGEHERATVEFSPDGKAQMITWEWRPGDIWLPLCDRVAIKEA